MTDASTLTRPDVAAGPGADRRVLQGRPEFSVVVPVRNEAGNVEALVEELATHLDGRAYEMIFIDDCSTDDTRARLGELKERHPALRVLAHRRNAGQSRAVRSGVVGARGAVIVTLDGDGQNDPADVLGLVNQLTRPDAPPELALVQGQRSARRDSSWKRFGSRVANRVRQSMLKDDSPDSGCGARAFRRDVFLQLPYFDHMHRYLPALMQGDGYAVETRKVNHRARKHGKSNYTNFGRLGQAISDMRGVLWLRKRRRRPGGVDEI